MTEEATKLFKALNILPSKKASWEQCVKALGDTIEFKTALKVMQCLNKSKGNTRQDLLGNNELFEEAKEIMEDAGSSWQSAMRMVTHFCYQGVNFDLETNKELSNEDREYLLKLRGKDDFETKLINETASTLHENWRQTRKKEDGTYEPCWRETADPAILEYYSNQSIKGKAYMRPSTVKYDNGHMFIDIANTPFKELEAELQTQNLEMAKVAAGLAIRSKTGIFVEHKPENITQKQIGEEIYSEWKNNNKELAQNNEMFSKPFTGLPDIVQAGIISPYQVAATTLEKLQTQELEKQKAREQQEREYREFKAKQAEGALSQ